MLFDPTTRGRFSSGGFLTVEDFTFNFYMKIFIISITTVLIDIVVIIMVSAIYIRFIRFTVQGVAADVRIQIC